MCHSVEKSNVKHLTTFCSFKNFAYGKVFIHSSWTWVLYLLGPFNDWIQLLFSHDYSANKWKQFYKLLLDVLICMAKLVGSDICIHLNLLIKWRWSFGRVLWLSKANMSRSSHRGQHRQFLHECNTRELRINFQCHIALSYIICILHNIRRHSFHVTDNAVR